MVQQLNENKVSFLDFFFPLNISNTIVEAAYIFFLSILLEIFYIYRKIMFILSFSKVVP